VLLTCAHLYVTTKYPADGVASDAPVGRTVDILAVSGRRKGQEHEGTIFEEPPDPGYIARW
jgi:hypothetical protein